MKIFYTLSFVCIVIFSSCHKNSTEPVPETKVESVAFLSRVFNYADPNLKDSTGYSTVRDSLSTNTTVNSSGQISLLINMPFSKGRDYVKFIIDQANIKPGYVGTYELKPVLPGGFQGDAQAVYGYRRDQYSYTELGAGNATGVFVITSYDAQRKLLAGNYRYTIHSFHNPKVGMNWEETNIIVAGEFQNVVLP